MVIDFAVANYCPRVIELAVMAVDLLFNSNDVEAFPSNWQTALNGYQEKIQLTDKELQVLPIFVKVAHAMHIIGGTREKAEGNTSEENEYWLNKGRVGLRYILKIW